MTCQVLGTGDPAMSQCPPGGDYIPAGRQATDRKIRLSNMKEKKKKKWQRVKGMEMNLGMPR